MKKKYLFLILSLSLITFSLKTFAQEEPMAIEPPPPTSVPNLLLKPTQVIWEEEDENGNFRVDQYTVRGSRILIGNRQKLYAVLTDFENYDKWMPYFKVTRKIDPEHLNFIFQTKNFGDYNLTLKIEYPRRNMNGYYHWVRLTTEGEFPYSTLKTMEHNFYLHQVYNTQTGALDDNFTLIELANHTKVAGLLAAFPESKIREIFLNVIEQLFRNLQLRLDSIENK
ncbi:MAG: hypothetical protein A2Z91_05290 [Deltaproteobacteria bacterium GWA2_38_16]|nr:MAG: hypothetical protein A2Z91_05290 [Deltaproteobacteria bacterium GWA2_38_16]OGQ03192.1 MAG: hypothetical protein A3D19_04020 [Deltaproteobacteria bacterium RIFCSPHIGHO2_02_FULL_38_15]OGQ34671.1 MAG: hypothetical protein A3A72_00870 [Deltaproteobacteria bacterium RIFCSPLOWO2_01_FULL_38_9]OGQ60184.1 MAG: hypothetical protein A3G92_04670 [Deltaproteobacteria bacterium RIFCSPLOWO2_12_FULL_38_8]HBQ20382.1 hypothetical protein [Deltaproteobacteria bacterium]